MTDKKNITDRFYKAVQNEKEGNFSFSLNEYVSIIHEDPTYREAYLNLGSLYSRMNKLDEAMNCYQEALKLKKDYITYFNIGSIFYKLNNYKKAVINLEKSNSLNNSFILSSLVMGLCYSRMNNYRAAESNFIDVLKITPANRVALTALAILFYNQDKFDKSMNLLNRLIKLDNTNSKIRELKSNILYKTGNIDESAREIKAVTKISNGYIYYDEFIKSIPVEAYTDKYGTINEKIEFLRESADKDKNSLISLSLCHMLKGETDLAIDYLFEVKKQFS